LVYVENQRMARVKTKQNKKAYWGKGQNGFD